MCSSWMSFCLVTCIGKNYANCDLTDLNLVLHLKILDIYYFSYLVTVLRNKKFALLFFLILTLFLMEN